MTKFETNLWTFLSKKTYINFNLLERLNMAINLASEVQKMSGSYDSRSAHKDLKPSNIMLDLSCNLRLIDFGIGRTYGGFIEKSSGGSCGTVAFLAPEQFTCKEQTYKVDIWALGKILALIVFEWSFGWQLLWSPKFLKPDEIKSLGPLVELIDLIKNMIEVSNHYTYCYLSDYLLHIKISTSLIEVIFVFQGQFCKTPGRV